MLSEAIAWANSLNEHDLAWELMMLADDHKFHSDPQRKALVHVILKKAGL